MKNKLRSNEILVDCYMR